MLTAIHTMTSVNRQKALLDKIILRTTAVITEKNEDLRSREAELEANLDGPKICHSWKD